MGVDIASLVLAVDSTQVDKGTTSLDRLAKAGEGATASSNTLAKAGAALGVAIAGAAVATVALVRQAIDAADAMNDMHIKTGLAFKDLAAYDLLARQSGTTLQGIEQGFKFLGKSMTDNRDELDALGVTSKDVNVAMGQFANVIASINDPALRTTIAMKYLGRSGMDLIPALSGGAAAFDQARKDTAAYGEALAKTAPASDAFNDKMAKLRIQVSLVSQIMADKLLPLLTVLADDSISATEGIEGLGEAFDPVTEAFRAAVILGGNLAFVLRGIGTEAGGVAAQLAALASGDLAGFKAIGEAMREDAERNRAAFDAWEKKVLEAGKSVAVAATTGAEGVKKMTAAEEEQLRTAEKRAKAAQEAAKQYAAAVKASAEFITGLKKEVETFGMSEGAKKMYEAGIISLTLHKGRARNEFIDSAAAYVMEKEAQEAAANAAEKIAEAEKKRQEQIHGSIKTLQDQTDAINDNAAKMLLTGDQLRQHIVLRAMEKSGLESSTQAYVEMKKRLNEALANEEVAKKVKETMDQATEFTKQAARNMQDAFADMFFDIMEGKFNNMADSFKRSLDRMVANAMAAKLSNYLLGDFGKTGELGGMIGGFAKNMFSGGDVGVGGMTPEVPGSAPGGSIFDTLFSWLPKFDVGTDFVPQTGPAIVHQGEKITPAAQNASSFKPQPVNITNNFTISGAVDRRSQAQIAAQAGAAVNRALRRHT